MGGEHKPKHIRILLCVGDDNIEEAISGYIKRSIKGKYDLWFTSSYYADDVLRLANEHTIDLFMMVVNNIIFRSEDSSAEQRIEKALQLVSFLSKTYKRPVIALYGWPNDPLFPEKTKQAGANFCIKLPSEPKEIREAIEVCLGLKTHGNVLSFPSSNT